MLHNPTSICWLRSSVGLDASKRSLLKVPTIVSYDPLDSDKFTWGSQSHKYTEIEGMNLLLDHHSEVPLWLPAARTETELQKLGKLPVDVVTDYLKALWNHALGIIQSKVPAEYLESCQKIFVLSVPAVCSDKAKDLTIRVSNYDFPINVVPDSAAGSKKSWSLASCSSPRT